MHIVAWLILLIGSFIIGWNTNKLFDGLPPGWRFFVTIIVAGLLGSLWAWIIIAVFRLFGVVL